MSLQKNLSTDDIVQLCQFDLLTDDSIYNALQKEPLPEELRRYIQLNVSDQ
jgi:hypothetical protein